MACFCSGKVFCFVWFFNSHRASKNYLRSRKFLFSEIGRKQLKIIGTSFLVGEIYAIINVKCLYKILFEIEPKHKLNCRNQLMLNILRYHLRIYRHFVKVLNSHRNESTVNTPCEREREGKNGWNFPTFGIIFSKYNHNQNYSKNKQLKTLKCLLNWCSNMLRKINPYYQTKESQPLSSMCTDTSIK